MAGEEENPKPVGGRGWSWFLWPNGGAIMGEEISVLGLGFFVLSLQMCKIAPPLLCVLKATIYRKKCC
jgi:hypothetical protein